MSRSTNWWIAAIALASAVPLGDAEAGGRPVVVELFTSESCSSCPPADALLVELARDRPDVLPLAFHVTYWDQTGWRDPYSLPTATARQQHYAALLGTNSVYTPEIVVDGRSDVIGSHVGEVEAAIRSAASAAPGVTAQAIRDAGAVTVDVGAGSGAGTIWLVTYDGQHRTSVGGGENSGRELVEANIVRTLTPVGPWHGAPVRTRVASPALGEQAAVFVQADDGRIIAAARASGH